MGSSIDIVVAIKKKKEDDWMSESPSGATFPLFGCKWVWMNAEHSFGFYKWSIQLIKIAFTIQVERNNFHYNINWTQTHHQNEINNLLLAFISILWKVIRLFTPLNNYFNKLLIFLSGFKSMAKIPEVKILRFSYRS